MSLLGKLARIHSRDCSVSKHRYVNMAGVITYLNLNFRKPVTISKLCTVAGMLKIAAMINNDSGALTTYRIYFLGVLLLIPLFSIFLHLLKKESAVNCAETDASAE